MMKLFTSLSLPTRLFFGVVLAMVLALSAGVAENFPIGNLGIKSLSDGGANDEPLPPDEAFAMGGVAFDGQQLTMSWTIKPNYYLYQGKFKTTLLTSDGFALGEPVLPEGDPKEDEFFGTIYAVHDFAELAVPLTRRVEAATELAVEVSYQGCAELLGICYPPQVKWFTTPLPALTDASDSKLLILDEVPVGSKLAGVQPAEASADKSEPPTAENNNSANNARADKAGNASNSTDASAALPASEQDQIAAMLSGGNTFWVLLSFLGFGLLLSLTPCVFPMIPILSGIIAGQQNITSRKAFTLSLVYVLAMALTYTVAGVLAGLFGSNLQAALQNPWALGLFSAIFVLLALSMFGFYDLQIPTSWQTRLNEFSNKQAGGSLIGVAIMGILSALIVGPCVAAPLAGALIYIGMTGDAVLGGMALFALSIGMGIPLLIVGTLAGNYLPRAGRWMEAVKAVFGVMLLGVAIWMLERVLPMPLVMMLWAALLIISAVFMGVFSSLSEQSSGWHKLWKGVGIMLLVHGIMLMIGAANGGNDVLQPLKGTFSAAPAAASGGSLSSGKLAFRPVNNLAELQQALDESAGKAVMLDFYADWCVSCKEMEKYTFPDPEVRAALADMVLLKADVTANNAEHKAMMEKFTIFGPPAMLFFDSKGQEVKPLRLVGFMAAEAFSAHVRQVK